MKTFLAIFYLALLSIAQASQPALLWLAYDPAMLAPALELAKTRSVVAVLNPSDGPGTQRDIAFGRFVTSSKSLPNLRLVGYIDLVTWHGDNWSAKPSKSLAAERDLWHSLYRIDDYWLDDCFAGQQAIRQIVQAWPRAANTFVNAGEPLPASHWLRATGFTVCDFEDPPATTKTFSQSHGPCMILFTTQASWQYFADAATKQGARYVGFEDITRHHSGEFQKPFTWWEQLK
jgi:hypothetical protein